MTFEELRNKYNEFKNKYNNQYTDYDGYYGSQCWDLAQRYFVEYLGVPEYVLSGCGLVSNMLNEPKRSELLKYFDEISIYEMGPGDVCIWEYGHIAIFDNWDGNQNWYFSQNPNPCQVMTINRDGLHAFRLKGLYQPEPTPVVNDGKIKELQEQIKTLENRIVEVTEQRDKLISEQPTKIFTCTKTSNYKIKLYENEELYIKKNVA